MVFKTNEIETNDVRVAENGILVLPKGIVFPAAPVDGQLFFRSDEEMIYKYDGSKSCWWAILDAGSCCFKSDVTLAGATPIDADVTTWADGNRGHGVGTTSREFYMVKRGTAVKYVEMS